MTRAAIDVPAEARALVDEINGIRAGFWSRLHDLNENDANGGPRTTGADIDNLLTQDDAKKALEAQIRRRHFPRAARVTVDQWGVYTWSPTGRVVRMVWKISPPRTHVE